MKTLAWLAAVICAVSAAGCGDDDGPSGGTDAGGGGQDAGGGSDAGGGGDDAFGFDDEVMAGWFMAAGLTLDHVEHLEGGELTVTLWRGVKAGVPQRQRRAA